MPAIRGNATISLPANDTRLSTPLAMPAQEQAWLTFQAMDRSDDIVLLLECDLADAPHPAVIVGVNGAFRRASGFADGQVLGSPVTALFPIGEDAETLLAAIRTRETLRAELRCARADGGTFMLGLHLMPAQERAPGRLCFAVLARDITQALAARKTQNSIQLLLAKVFISVDEAVAIVDGGGRIVMTNPHVDRLLGYAPNGLVGRDSIELVAPDARATAAAMRQQQLEQGGDKTFNVPLLRADGARLDARLTSVLVGSDDLRQFRIVTLRAAAGAHAGSPAGAIVGSPGGAETEMRTEAAGRIRLIGIEEVRAALGDRWPALASRAMATAEAVIRRRCGPHDSYERTDDTSFLMCFGMLSEPEASFRAAVIGREIRERLIGQGNDDDTAQVRAVAAAVRFPDRLAPGPVLRAALLEGLDQQMERLEQEARQTLQEATAGVACVLERISGRNPEETVANLVRLPTDLERKVVCALSILSHKETDAFDLDGLLLGLAAQQALGAIGRGEATRLLVNIRYDVFGTRAATERYASLCMQIDPRIARRLVLLLTALPANLPRPRLAECLTRLRPHCATVGFQADDLTGLAAIDLSHSTNALIALPATALLGTPPDRLKEVFSGLHARRAKVLVRRIGSEEDAAQILLLGADMISMERPK